MTPNIQNITPNTIPGYALANPVWINAVSGIANLLKDRITFIGASGAILQSSTNVDTSTTPTWTNLYTFPTTSGRTIAGFQELANGEAMVVMTESGQSTNLSHVYVSSGWSVNKATATWTETLATIGGNVTNAYSMHDWSSAADGTVLMSESGGQTSGGSANVTSDLIKGRRVWLSKDFGLTWALVFDIYTFGQAQGIAYPASVHVHGVGYDQEWQRIWICYGDNTGDGKNIAGTGYVQVVSSDDGGSSWQKLVTPPYWNNSGQLALTLQYIVPVIFNNAVVFTTDATPPNAPVIYPKTGFRKLGEAYLGPNYRTAVAGQVRKVLKDARFPTFFTGVLYTAQTGTSYCTIPVTDDDGFTWSTMRLEIPVQTPNIPSLGFSQILGPTLNGKIVCLSGMYANNDNTKKTLVADLVQL